MHTISMSVDWDRAACITILYIFTLQLNFIRVSNLVGIVNIFDVACAFAKQIIIL